MSSIYFDYERSELVARIWELEQEVERLKPPSNRPKLSEKDVKEIRRLWRNARATSQELADMYGVNRSTISRIISGQYHKDVV